MRGASGYLALNNGERQFVPEFLAPQRVFELQFTAPETTPLGSFCELPPAESRILI
jgi:hypothetical protein